MSQNLNELPQEVYQIGNLIVKYNEKNITAGDRAILEEWIAKSEVNKRLFEELANSQFAHAELSYYHNAQESKERAFKKIIALQGFTQAAILPLKKAKYGLWKMIAAAAIVTGVISAGAYFMLSQNEPKVAQGKLNNKVINDVEPGGQKAVLVLEDGRKVLLTDAQNGLIANQGSAQVEKRDGLIEYKTNRNLKQPVAFNTIVTPKGGTYQVLLEDGSKVWLNAASSINFPTAFIGKDRRVKISGEVYFEIAHSPGKPFLVSVEDMEVQVLGTKFNIESYKDKGKIKTTLLSGSVKVKTATQEKVIKPGEQAQVGTGTMAVVNNVDVQKTTAWKEGFFRFKHDKLTDVLKDVSRWYDIEVKYEEDFSDLHITGKINRSSNLSEVLEILSLLKINYELEGKILIIKSDKK